MAPKLFPMAPKLFPVHYNFLSPCACFGFPSLRQSIIFIQGSYVLYKVSCGHRISEY